MGKLPSSPKGFMILRLSIEGNRFAILISAYAPTMINPDNIKVKFYDDLNNLIEKTPSLGDLYARVGTDWKIWKGVLGRHGIEKNNSNGDLPLVTFSTYGLLITNTCF